MFYMICSSDVHVKTLDPGVKVELDSESEDGNFNPSEGGNAQLRLQQ